MTTRYSPSTDLAVRPCAVLVMSPATYRAGAFIEAGTAIGLDLAAHRRLLVNRDVCACEAQCLGCGGTGVVGVGHRSVAEFVERQRSWPAVLDRVADQRQVDRRIAAQAYTRAHGEDDPEIAGWTWPQED